VIEFVPYYITYCQFIINCSRLNCRQLLTHNGTGIAAVAAVNVRQLKFNTKVE
jgi:hypothetical protein